MPGPVHPDGYRERLSAPWWAYPVVVGVAVLIGLECSILAGALWAQALVVVGFALAGLVLVWRYGDRVVEVRDGQVRAGDWRLPVSRVRGVAILDAATMRAELRRRDEDVYRCTRSWVPTAVMLDVDDPDDLPYWLVSTRHPHRLASALAFAAEHDGTPAPVGD